VKSQDASLVVISLASEDGYTEQEAIVTTRVVSATFDCRDPFRQAEFWATALSYVIEDPIEGMEEVGISDPSGEGLSIYFMPVPEPKTAKNRVHLDLEPETTMQEEVARLVAAGARVVAIHQDPEGPKDPFVWTVMQDPEGNEFCVATPMPRPT
jgi:hypothetical protein